MLSQRHQGSCLVARLKVMKVTNWRAVFLLAGKDLRLLLRDRTGLFVTFVFPFAYCIFFGIILANRTTISGSIPIAVVDEDNTEWSTTFVHHLQRTRTLDVIRAEISEARTLVRTGKVVLNVLIPVGFAEACARYPAGQAPRLEVDVNGTQQLEAAYVRGELARHVLEIIATRSAAGEPRQGPCESPGEASVGVVIDVAGDSNSRSAPENGFAVSFPQGIVWGVMGCCATFVTSLVIERHSGLVARLRMAPIGRVHILGGKALACLASTMTVAVAALAIGYLAFGVTPECFWHVAVSLILIAAAFVGIMMFLSVLGRSVRSTSGISWGVLLAMAMLGGGMVPYFLMPTWMQQLSVISPVKWSILALEGAIWRGYTTADMLLPWSVLGGIGLLFFAIGARCFAVSNEG